MSVEAAWDLHAKASPRSLCIYTASPSSQETNPFDVAAAGAEVPSAQAVVFGTERGSLHYRTYSNVSTPGPSTTLPPLGMTSRGNRQSTQLPRAYLPVDLAEASLPGSVVSVIAATNAPSHRPIFLVLVDDNRGASGNQQPGHYAAVLVTLQHGSFSKLPTQSSLPRMSSATFDEHSGFVFCAGRKVRCLPSESFLDRENRPKQRSRHVKRLFEYQSMLPSPGPRGGQDALVITMEGRIAVVAVGNSVYAIPGTEVTTDSATPTPSNEMTSTQITKAISFSQSSQVHPMVVVDIKDESMERDWVSMFLANGREAAVIDMQYNQGSIHCGVPRNGMVTLASPILAAAGCWPWLALLTSDGLISIRSPSCLAVPLKTVEVGTRPNDFFVLRTFKEEHLSLSPTILAMSYSGEGKTLRCYPDSAQDLADRLMRHSIDAFGSNGFPRSELAEALNASFTATSYVGPEPSSHTRELLRQYLEASLSLTDFEGGASSGWPTEINITNALQNQQSPKNAASLQMTAFQHLSQNQHQTSRYAKSKFQAYPVLSSKTPNSLVTGTALLCLVCTMIHPSPKAALANRAAKSCAAKMGVVHFDDDGESISRAAVKVSEMVADRLLREAAKTYTLLTSGAGARLSTMEFVEAASWLLRSCGKHERAIGVLYEWFQQHRSPESRAGSSGGLWSQIKYESYTATHLSELWATSKSAACQLVLRSPVTKRLLEYNPRLGLNVFTVLHPQNEASWRRAVAKDDPLSMPYAFQVVELLKTINPLIIADQQQDRVAQSNDDELQMDSGRALAVSFLESAIGISSGRPRDIDAFDSLDPDEKIERHTADFHDELCYLLLEGVIADHGNNIEGSKSLGEVENVYRKKLRRLLQWPLAKVRSERLLNSLPELFLQEKALVLGRLGKHEEALKILYCDCRSMELALEYCDLRHEQLQREAERIPYTKEQDYDSAFAIPLKHDCAYLPLVKVALHSDAKQGATTAIQVLALRRNEIDRAAALRLLPKNVPLSAVARPFLIPALVESESQARRLRVVSSLLRARHIVLKQKLTAAQLKAQANLHVVPQLRSMNLGEPLHSTKPFKARPSASAPPAFPDVVIVKHFFPRHVVIQAKVTNASNSIDGRAIGNTAFVVAESSEEAIQPSTQVPIKVLPFGATGSTWCVLTAAPHRMEGTAILTCELRYTVLPSSDALGGGVGRPFVEELQDLEVYSSHFS